MEHWFLLALETQYIAIGMTVQPIQVFGVVHRFENVGIWHIDVKWDLVVAVRSEWANCNSNLIQRYSLL